MPSTETTVDPETVIMTAIGGLLQRRGVTGIVVGPESNLLADLSMDSLELAELSAALVDEVGHDPFSEGIFPETIAELVAFYNP